VAKVVYIPIEVLSVLSKASVIDGEEVVVRVLVVLSVLALAAVVGEDEWNCVGDVHSWCVSKEPAVCGGVFDTKVRGVIRVKPRFPISI